MCAYSSNKEGRNCKSYQFMNMRNYFMNKTRYNIKFKKILTGSFLTLLKNKCINAKKKCLLIILCMLHF